MKDKILIHEFQKNALEKVIIQFTEFNRNQLIDIRVYYNARGAKEEWRPSRKGLSVRTEQIPELKKGVDKAFKEWEKKK